MDRACRSCVVCDGSVKTNEEGRREAISKMSVIVNFAEQTVSFAGYVSQIQNVDGPEVFFGSGIDPSDRRYQSCIWPHVGNDGEGQSCVVL
jgi:hypothetical protein